MHGLHVTTRLAPSPTGRIHAGTIFAAMQAWLLAKSTHGSVVLRIEDLDEERSKPEFADAIMRDYEEMGLVWDSGPYFQHNRKEAYRAAYEKLEGRGLLYECFCTRADLRSASAPHLGQHNVYDRRCLHLTKAEVQAKREKLLKEGRGPSVRIKVPNSSIEFSDIYQGEVKCNINNECGDFIVRRGDGGFAYQLAVVVDDASQDVNLVARGYDLLPCVPQQLFLYDVLELKPPKYAHFPLFCASDGRRLAKRNKDASYDELKARLGGAAEVIGHIAYVGGIQEKDEPTSMERLLKQFDVEKLRGIYKDTISITFKS